MTNVLISAMRKSTISALTFNPNMWEHFIDAGCYPYALDLEINEYLLVGDIIGERCTESTSDELLINTLFKEVQSLGFSIKHSETDSTISTNQFKIYLQRYERTGYYHFLRQDNTGIWSHKFPKGLPIQTDSCGQLILDPDCMVEAPFYGWCFLLEKEVRH